MPQIELMQSDLPHTLYRSRKDKVTEEDVILDDTAFQKKIANIESAAQKLNATVTQLLQIQASIAATSDSDVQNARAQNRILVDNAKAQEKIRREAEKTVLAQQKNAEALRRTRESVDIALENERARASERTAAATAKTAAAQIKLNQSLAQSSSSISSQSRLLREMTALAGSYVSILGATRLVKNLVNVSAEFELQRTTLVAILGDVEQANKLFGQMKELAVMSPFQFKELASYAKQLSA
ncbi:unnamed protein product [Cylicocyclus nassatus]|uniref:Uncharacterized protein n=1 Tax=Cylicocyclus nassatus TaxID=53992 RepID=A0AA36GYH9_CYLNA|nr:unnamed protein product [Cylicocyclus nassatus]